MTRRRPTSFRTSVQDVAASKRAPQTPQTQSSAFRLAFADDEFMTSEDTRGIRFQLEYLKPEFRLRERGINSTVVLFGGARIPAPGQPACSAIFRLQFSVQKRGRGLCAGTKLIISAMKRCIFACGNARSIVCEARYWIALPHPRKNGAAG